MIWWFVPVAILVAGFYVFRWATQLLPDDEIELDLNSGVEYISVYLRGVEAPPDSIFSSRPGRLVAINGPFLDFRILLAAASIRREVDKRERLKRRRRALEERHGR